MRDTVFLLCAACVAGSAALAQVPPPPSNPQPPASQSVLKDDERLVTVAGCIRGKQLLPAMDGLAHADNVAWSALKADSFNLEGPKETMQLIANLHDRHLERVTGIARIPPTLERQDSTFTAKKLGPLSVNIGGRQEKGKVRESPRPIRLKVSSIEHLAERCYT
jgi:hypothetical protein